MSSTIPLPPREQLCNRYCSYKNTHTHTTTTTTFRKGYVTDNKIKALRFRRDHLDHTLIKVARDYNDPAYKWFSALGWKYKKQEYDQEYPGRTEYHLVIKNPKWICPPPTKSDVDIIRGRHDEDKSELKKWRCAICLLGLPEDGIEEDGIEEDGIEAPS
jgi:hypothetical protein